MSDIFDQLEEIGELTEDEDGAADLKLELDTEDDD